MHNIPINFAINHPDPEARQHARNYKKAVQDTAKALGSLRGNPSPQDPYDYAGKAEAAEKHRKRYEARIKELTKSEELEPKGHLLKEKTPKKKKMTRKEEKIKLSGKKDLIDTEPTLNTLTATR
jgi:predicted S18 family serine protease